MYEDILLPFDGSDGAVAVLDHAADIADWADATIHVLFVADTTRHSVTVVGTEVVDTLVRKGKDIVEDAASSLSALGVDHEVDVVQGNPAPTIAEYAERYGHDLVVMPTHAREGVSRYLVGSVTEKVVRLSSVPVLTARMQPDEQLSFPYQNILIPTDGSPGATAAGEHGLELAAGLGATVHALSVLEESPLGLDLGSAISGEEQEQAATDAVEELAIESERYDVPEVVRHVEQGTPLEVILDTIESQEIDAVVMGTTGSGGTEGILLGSVAEKTLRTAPVPVITVGRGE